MKVYIRQNTNYYSIVLYVLKLIEKNINYQFEYLNSPEQASIIFDHTHINTETLAVDFYDKLKRNDTSFLHKFFFSSTPFIKTEKNEKDSIATIFYMVNCLQEFNPDQSELDNFGRFKYESSFQFKFNNIQENLVQKEIDIFSEKHKLTRSKKQSTFFISHDIDTIYGSFLQDGFWALKKMRLDIIMNLIIWEISNRPHWKNIDKIIKINSDYDIRTTFFWLVNKGKGTQNIQNADYDINKEKKMLDMVTKSNCVNGLHKSCSEMSINEELEKGQLQTTYNRYHFLNFLPHRDWTKISESNLNFDCSLGFAEHFGFRNSYGKAFQPYDFINDKPYDFVEAPLHFMDGTFHKYMKIPINQTSKIVIGFYEKNATNCDFSLLWHNTYFTKYKYNSYLEEYKKIIGFIYENKIACLSPQELVEENRIKW